MNKEEIEILIGSYLAKARDISYKFSTGNLGNENYIQQFVDSINKLVNPKPLIEHKIESFNYFLAIITKFCTRYNNFTTWCCISIVFIL